jgi:hypothetical protein
MFRIKYVDVNEIYILCHLFKPPPVPILHKNSVLVNEQWMYCHFPQVCVYHQHFMQRMHKIFISAVAPNFI